MDLKILATNFGAALAMRLGTMGAVWLMANGVPQSLAEQLATAVGVLGGILFDIVVTLFLKNRGR